jgi:hypothetical protein
MPDPVPPPREWHTWKPEKYRSTNNGKWIIVILNII